MAAFRRLVLAARTWPPRSARRGAILASWAIPEEPCFGDGLAKSRPSCGSASSSRGRVHTHSVRLRMRALAKRPDDRFPSAAALRHALPDAPVPAALERV
jgi:hypothetical protein